MSTWVIVKNVQRNFRGGRIEPETPLYTGMVWDENVVGDEVCCIVKIIENHCFRTEIVFEIQKVHNGCRCLKISSRKLKRWTV